MDESVLEGVGLTKGEIKVYLSLLDIGESTTGGIIEKSKLSSGKIYEILDKLIDKGLATYIVKGKTKYFSATNPKNILEYVDRKKKEIENKKKEVEEILPGLLDLYKNEGEAYNAVIYKGIEGFRTAVFEILDELDSNDEWLAFGVSVRRKEIINRMWDRFTKERAKKKVKLKMLVSDQDTMKRYKVMPISEIRILETAGKSPIALVKDYVIIFNFKDLSVLKITNKTIAESFREFFYNLWSIAKK